MTLGGSLSDVVTLLVTVDPVGLAPIFLALTARMTRAQRVEVAVRSTAIAFGVLTFFALSGDAVLRLLGISLPAFQIAGGLLLFWIAFEMVFETRPDRKQSVADVAITQDQVSDIAAFPIAIPLLAGPGSITATILIAGRMSQTGGPPLLLVGWLAAIMLASLAVFVVAQQLAGTLGATGNSVLTRMLGIILAALAVQFVITGAKAI